MKQVSAYRLINRYRRLGHLHAEVNPLVPALGIAGSQLELSALEGLTGNTKLDVAQWLPHWEEAQGGVTASQLQQYLQKAYCGSVTGEFHYVTDQERRDWLAQQLEQREELYGLTDEQRLRVLRLLQQSDVFDHFLHTKFRNLKRYALEGCEAMLPAMDELFRAAGCEEVVIGMPHRGRLNLLCSLLKFPPRTLFRKIRGETDVPSDVRADTGDVISHLAINTRIKYDSQRVNVSLLHNPSHLEGVNPVALGRTHARQLLSGKDALCVQVHGDAAFALQGVNYESVQLARLPNFGVGGTVHLIVNNQIGFTAEASTGRSSRYSSDLAKMMEFPVLRVNANDPEAVVQTMRIASAYRARFRDDVFVDLMGFRRHGHNELDQPMFTNPIMYAKIERLRPIAEVYAEQGEKAGWLPAGYVEEEREKAREFLNSELVLSEEPKSAPQSIPHLERQWKPFLASRTAPQSDPESTGVDKETLHEVGMASVRVPDEHVVHSRLNKVFLQVREERLQSGRLDWALAETLAFGSLLRENYNVRLCGQDSGRGTFSQRHLALTCQQTQRVVFPLQAAGSGKLQVINSPLAELAVLAFEYGWSVEDPHSLVLWEAQYGDFFNSAQVTIDTFVSSGEHKWQRPSALVMLLPHGYDGAGPEHSSCRMERFLQGVGTNALDTHCEADDLGDINWRIINPTTPANYFHALRRQMLSGLRKPLIVVAPKTLLRHADAVSSYEDLAPGTAFQSVLDDPEATGDEEHVVFCTGKVFYEMERKEGRAVVRLEELAPFPYEGIKRVLQRYPNMKRMTWFQEEPQNMGAYSYVYPRFSRFIIETQVPLAYVGRPAMAAPAVGVGEAHKLQVKELFEELQ